ncbi:hypothetical protein ACYJ1Y_15970 [Natrialbaceae archaeon A-gly3]
MDESANLRDRALADRRLGRRLESAVLRSRTRRRSDALPRRPRHASEELECGSRLAGNGRRELFAGFTVGFVSMVLLLVVFE